MKFNSNSKVKHPRSNSKPCELGQSDKNAKPARNNKSGMRFVRGQTEFEMDQQTVEKLGSSVLTAFKYSLAAVVSVVLIAAIATNVLAQNPNLWGLINWSEQQGATSKEDDKPANPVEDDHLFP